MRRWLRRRRVWLMHGPAAVGGRSRAGYFALALLCVALALGWTYRELTLANGDVAQTRSAYETLLRDQAQQQEELRHLRARNLTLEAQITQQRELVTQAQALTNTVQSQNVADQATQTELTRQLQLLQQENGRLKQDLAFFQGAIPKEGGNGAVALRAFEAQRLSPTQVHWQALVVQPVKNAKSWEGRLNITVSGTRAGKAWVQSLVEGPRAVNLVQFVRLEGVMNIPADVDAQAVTAKLSQGKRVMSVQTHKF